MHRLGMNRLDAVSIRIGLADTQNGQAVEALGLQSIRPSRSTLHLLDYRIGPPSPSLASTGVTISVHDSGDLSLPDDAGAPYPARAPAPEVDGLLWPGR